MDYQFSDIEKKWQKFWAETQTFKVEADHSKPKYYVLDMFPYPSGAGLHVGHPLGYIASDIFARYKRIKGFNVLHPMGYDSFGLPAEQYAIQTGQHPALTTETNINRYREQLDNLGFSFDWSREVRTSSPDFYKWTQWIFMQLFNSWYNLKTGKAEPITTLIHYFETSGINEVQAVCDEDVQHFQPSDWSAFSAEEKLKELLKYRLTYLRESTVNWCPALGTVLANDEVKDGFSERGGYPVEQKKMMQWSMRITAYAERLLQGLNTIDWPEPVKEMQRNWIGKSIGAMVKFHLIPNPSPPAEKGAAPELSPSETFSGSPSETDFPSENNTSSKNFRPGYMTANVAYYDTLKAFSRENRKNQTVAEEILWQRLRNNLTGFKIRRQHVIEGFITDFVCISKGVVIEVDGDYHLKLPQIDYDAARTQFLNDAGFEVIRFTNDEVTANPEKVVKTITEKLQATKDKYPKEKISEESKNAIEGEALASEGNKKLGADPLSNGEGEGRGEAVEVFTTRVDTIFGVSFLVLAPEHELVAKITTAAQQQEVTDYILKTKKKSERDRMADVKTVSGAFTGAFAVNPLNGEQVPVWIADYVLAGYGTGAVMAVPSGDQRDYLFAKQYQLPIIQIIDIQNIEQEADATKEGKYVNSGFINGLTYRDATAAVIKKLEENGDGYGKINYRMRDAIFGRQRYWGEPVPVYFNNGLPYLIDENALPLVLPDVDKYLPTETGEPPLGRAADWKYKNEFDYELSTMPGWAGSSWYWYRYMDAQNNAEFAGKEAIDYWQAVDLYIGGSEHATGHLLYSRFWNKFLKDLGYVNEEEPFKKLINQGHIQGRSNFVYRVSESPSDKPVFVSAGLKKDYKVADLHVDVNIVENDVLDIQKFKASRSEYAHAEFILEEGKYICGSEIEKMSKSKFNVVNPDDLVKRYGADTLRMYEMFLGPLEQSKPWNTNGIEGVFKFLRKFWKLFHDDQFQFSVSEKEPSKAELKALHKIIRKVEEDIERFSFNTSVSSFMICVNELTDLKCNNKAVLQDLVIVLSPYAPHICEELWQLLGNSAGSLSAAAYPTFNPEFLVENEFSYPVSINGKTRMQLNLSLSLDNQEIEKILLADENVLKYLEGKQPKRIIIVKGKIINLVC